MWNSRMSLKLEAGILLDHFEKPNPHRPHFIPQRTATFRMLATLNRRSLSTQFSRFVRKGGSLKAHAFTARVEEDRHTNFADKIVAP
jgi:hypothetical protein